MEQKSKVITDINICTIKELLVHFFCAILLHCFRDSFQLFSQRKKFFSNGNKVFRVDVNFINFNNFQLGNLSIEKVKAFCLEYCNDDRMRVAIKSNRTFWNYRTCLVASKVKERRWNKNKKNVKMVKANMKTRY